MKLLLYMHRNSGSGNELNIEFGRGEYPGGLVRNLKVDLEATGGGVGVSRFYRESRYMNSYKKQVFSAFFILNM
jgi:hypothetical protein